MTRPIKLARYQSGIEPCLEIELQQAASFDRRTVDAVRNTRLQFVAISRDAAETARQPAVYRYPARNDNPVSLCRGRLWKYMHRGELASIRNYLRISIANIRQCMQKQCMQTSEELSMLPRARFHSKTEWQSSHSFSTYFSLMLWERKKYRKNKKCFYSRLI